MPTVKPYSVTTEDPADRARSRRTFVTLAGARKRFEEMSGRTLEGAIREAFWFSRTKPTVETVRSVRTTSNYGTRVDFECSLPPVEAPRLTAAQAAPAPTDGLPRTHEAWERFQAAMRAEFDAFCTPRGIAPSASAGSLLDPSLTARMFSMDDRAWLEAHDKRWNDAFDAYEAATNPEHFSHLADYPPERPPAFLSGRADEPRGLGDPCDDIPF